MSREGGKRLLNALLLAYIAKYVFEHAKSRIVVRGDIQSALRHKRQKSERFNRNRFTARVGTRYHKRIKVLAEPYINRHYLLRAQ